MPVLNTAFCIPHRTSGILYTFSNFLITDLCLVFAPLPLPHCHFRQIADLFGIECLLTEVPSAETKPFVFLYCIVTHQKDGLCLFLSLSEKDLCTFEWKKKWSWFPKQTTKVSTQRIFLCVFASTCMCVCVCEHMCMSMYMRVHILVCVCVCLCACYNNKGDFYSTHLLHKVGVQGALR